MSKFTTHRNENSPAVKERARTIKPTGNHATGMSGSDFGRGYAPREMPAATENSPDKEFFEHE